MKTRKNTAYKQKGRSGKYEAKRIHKETSEEGRKKITYYAEGGAPLYVITRHTVTGVYRLYGVAAGEYKYLKQRAGDPLFREVCQ